MLIMDASVIIRMIVEITQMKETVKTTTIGNGDDDDDDDDDDEKRKGNIKRLSRSNLCPTKKMKTSKV